MEETYKKFHVLFTDFFTYMGNGVENSDSIAFCKA